MTTIGAPNPGHTLGPIGATGKLFQTVDDGLRRIGAGPVTGKREKNNVLDGPSPVRDIGSHTTTYVRKRVSDCMNFPWE